MNPCIVPTKFCKTNFAAIFSQVCQMFIMLATFGVLGTLINISASHYRPPSPWLRARRAGGRGEWAMVGALDGLPRAFRTAFCSNIQLSYAWVAIIYVVLRSKSSFVLCL